MDKRTLSTVALVAALFALVGGIWGLVERTDGANAADIEDTFMWIAIDLVLLSVSAICASLAARR